MLPWNLVEGQIANNGSVAYNFVRFYIDDICAAFYSSCQLWKYPLQNFNFSITKDNAWGLEKLELRHLIGNSRINELTWRKHIPETGVD